VAIEKNAIVIRWIGPEKLTDAIFRNVTHYLEPL
jgi:hypothetical protein